MTWPDRSSLTHVSFNPGGGERTQRWGRTVDGIFPGSTTVLKVFGLSTESLVRWSARVEREACLAAARFVYDRAFLNAPEGMHPREIGDAMWLSGAIEAHLGSERASQKKLEAAGDIGTQVHDRIRWFLAKLLKEERGPEPVLSSEPALRAFLTFHDWWQDAGLTPVRVEQPLWHPRMKYSGTADLIAHDGDALIVVDFKSGAGIYLEHHLQVMAYVHAARRHAHIASGMIIRLPKKAGESFDPSKDVESLGDWRYGKRVFTEEELLAAFDAACRAFWLLSARPEFIAKEAGLVNATG